jgi:hypothetical protein
LLDLLTQRFMPLPQAHDLLVFFEQHRKQEDLEGQSMRGVLGSRQVLAGAGEEVVQGQLVRAPQGAPEAGKGGLFLLENDGGGGEGSAHEF